MAMAVALIQCVSCIDDGAVDREIGKGSRIMIVGKDIDSEQHRSDRSPRHGVSTADGLVFDARLTEQLLNRLLNSVDIETFLKKEHVSDMRLTDYLRDLLSKHGLSRADVVRASGLNPTVVYDLFSGKSRPGRDTAVVLSLGLDCDLRETQRLLRLAGVSELWCKQRRDAIIIWCVNNGYDRVAVDHELIRFGEKPLLSRK